MSSEDFQVEVLAKIEAADAFTRIGRVGDWWASEFKGDALRVGKKFRVELGDTSMDFRVSEAKPGKRLVWEVSDCNLAWIRNKKEWKGTKVVWEISTRNGLTRVKMTHIGLVPGIECYKDCQRGWGFYVRKSLSKLFSEDRGLPDQG